MSQGRFEALIVATVERDIRPNLYDADQVAHFDSETDRNKKELDCWTI